MCDFLGTKLEVGDIVVCIKYGYHKTELMKGFIEKFYKGHIYVREIVNKPFSDNQRQNVVDGKSVVLIERRKS